jgi:putative NADH-flavin reductase
MEKRLRPALAQLASEAAAAGVRLGVVGGAGSLLVAEDGPTLVDSGALPEEARAEARMMTNILSDLRSDDGSLDWFLVSPAIVFGDFAPGETLGRYRIGGDVLLPGPNGPSELSGSDFGLAFIDEIQHPAHHRQRFSVAH